MDSPAPENSRVTQSAVGSSELVRLGHLMTRAGSTDLGGGLKIYNGTQFPYCVWCGWIDKSGGLDWIQQECPKAPNVGDQPRCKHGEAERGVFCVKCNPSRSGELAASIGSAEESELRNELKGVGEMLRRECVDWAEDHTYAQTVAKRVGVPVNKVEGDSYGVPGIQDLIDMIAERIPPNKQIYENE